MYKITQIKTGKYVQIINEEVLDLEDKVELTYNNDIKKTKLVEQNQYSKV